LRVRIVVPTRTKNVRIRILTRLGIDRTMEPPTAFDLPAYLQRIGYQGDLAPTPAVLQEVHFAHATHIPFENLDIHLGRPIRLDLPSLQDKLIRGRRGGYCFEHNTLLAAALEALGFPVTSLLARVRVGAATRITARAHMVLQVEADGRPWLADVGFGAGGLLGAIPLEAGPVHRQGVWSFRLEQEPGQWVLQAPQGDDWQSLYAFTLEPQYPIDFVVANHYTSTYPESIFVRTLTAQRSTPEARYALRGRELTVDRGGRVTTHTVADDEELLRLLAEPFGLELPPGTRFDRGC
jgi:N-hydroxyarylamine O-acetyltransferase